MESTTKHIFTCEQGATEDEVTIWTDTQTGVQYLQFFEYDCGCGVATAVTPRLNADGSLHIATRSIGNGDDTQRACGSEPRHTEPNKAATE
ncbi:MAG: DUF6440 family protein [Muribaculaceae bacterium]|nr:DUF6440 family protein [Muribaculaceae bacterium]